MDLIVPRKSVHQRYHLTGEGFLTLRRTQAGGSQRPDHTKTRLPDDRSQERVGMFAIVKRLLRGTRHCLRLRRCVADGPPFADVAQMVERLFRTQEARGSSPRIGTKFRSVSFSGRTPHL